MEYDKQLN